MGNVFFPIHFLFQFKFTSKCSNYSKKPNSLIHSLLPSASVSHLMCKKEYEVLLYYFHYLRCTYVPPTILSLSLLPFPSLSLSPSIFPNTVLSLFPCTSMHAAWKLTPVFLFFRHHHHHHHPSPGTYFNCIMFMVASSVVTTIMILNYHHRLADTHEMPPWVSTE